MAVVKYGSIITDIKGKIGGQVFQGSQYGPIMRNNYKGSNARNYDITDTNKNLAILATQWSDLSESQQQGWSDGAYQFPVKDKFGNDMILSGWNLFVHLNYYVMFLNESIITDCPTPVSEIQLYDCAGTYSIGAETFEITFTPSPAVEDNILMYELYAPIKERKPEKARRKKKAQTGSSNEATSPDNVSVPYDYQMHGPLSSLQLGWWIPVQFWTVYVKTGETSIKQWFYVQVEA